ncbi:MAG: flagellar basal body rod protein FlgB [Deltaproteobacteria bacterium]|nr:MAG: flagellar basal body rod protein FlgB [Deltaproteobacteria bacterium]HEX16466.1 flagellar basal body rod protein FlgB [Deltaproteobacteria bacterium]
MAGIFDRTIGLLERGLGLAWFRHTLLASNLANAETPGFQPRDISFTKELERAMEGVEMSLMRTHPHHLPPRGMSPNPEVVLRGGWGNPDGNKVDLEEEAVRLAENYLKYMALLRALEEKFSLLKYTIAEGGGP